jgi:cysteine desulfurase / selenocysteine lyase
MLRLGDRGAAFPALDSVAYLNHAAISPIALPVRQSIDAALDDYARRGSAAFGPMLRVRERLRARFAQLIGAEPREIAFIQNTTAGVIDVAFGVRWERGDRVVCFDGEFPANVSPFMRAAETFGLEVDLLSLEPFARSHEEGLAALEAHLTERPARLIAVSAVQFQTGLTMPVGAMGALAHEHGARLFVDAIQALGVVPMSVENVDFLSAGGHKWLLGVEGAGFLYARSEAMRELTPRLAGWLSHERATDFLFRGPGHLDYSSPLKEDAEVFETGTSSQLGVVALDASLAMLDALGVPAIFGHVQRYHDALEPELVARGFRSLRATFEAGRSGILAFEPPEGCDAVNLVKTLLASAIHAACPDGNLRFSPHFANAIDEVPRVVEATARGL